MTFSPILSSTAISIPMADDGALLCPYSSAQQNPALPEGFWSSTLTQRLITPSRGGVGASPATLQQATQAAQHAYETAKGAGNSRETIERLRRAWIMAKARECAGVAG